MVFTDKKIERLKAMYGCEVRRINDDMISIDGSEGSTIITEEGQRYLLEGYDVISVENGVAIAKEMEDCNAIARIKGMDIKSILLQRLNDGKKIITEELGYKIIDCGVISLTGYDLMFYDMDYRIADIFYGFGKSNIARVKEFIELPDGNIKIEVKVYAGDKEDLADKVILFDKSERKFKEA